MDEYNIESIYCSYLIPNLDFSENKIIVFPFALYVFI